MPGTTTTETSTAATREAAMFADLARAAMQRADELTRGLVNPDHEALALATVCAAAIEEYDDLGVERGSDWTDHLLDALALIARNRR